MRRITYLIICGAPPAGGIAELIDLLHTAQWEVWAIATDASVGWLDVSAIEALTGNPVARNMRRPDNESRLPDADLIIVAPATFNTINKWACGINDTPWLGVLNEGLGLRTPIIVSPYAKAPLAAHPAFQRNIATLVHHGVQMTDVEALRPSVPSAPFRWDKIMELVEALDR